MPPPPRRRGVQTPFLAEHRVVSAIPTNALLCTIVQAFELLLRRVFRELVLMAWPERCSWPRYRGQLVRCSVPHWSTRALAVLILAIDFRGGDLNPDI
ncbi:hypothetical protein BJY04DRAFT_183836 [Aspergillus karnatakaensis]|uniref:uncharacterized protein n=1 Tax=Aspergillus karnatakaensis TaxID=1810916 RepID=UPI003CCD01E5